MQLSETYSVTSFLKPIINTGLNICFGSSGDYEPFGSALPYRGFNTDKYRFGFNGQEKDYDLIEGLYGAEFWEYDSRTGKRWNPDPITYAWQSTYSTFNNNPIFFADPTGQSGVRDFFNKLSMNVQRGFQKIGKKLGIGGGADRMIDEVVCSYKKSKSTNGNSTKSSWFGEAVESVGNAFKSGLSWLSKSASSSSDNSAQKDNRAWYDKVGTAIQGHSETEGTWTDEYIGKPVGNFIYNANPLSSIPTVIDGGKTIITGTTMDGYHFNSWGNRLLYGGTSIVLSVAGNKTGTNTIQDMIIENLYFNLMTNTVTNTAKEIDKK